MDCFIDAVGAVKIADGHQPYRFLAIKFCSGHKITAKRGQLANKKIETFAK